MKPVNRRQRKLQMRLDGLSPWSEMKERYRPSILPINLGIKQYKRDHKGQGKRIAYYKEQIWAAYKDLKSAPSEPKTE